MISLASFSYVRHEEKKVYLLVLMSTLSGTYLKIIERNWAPNLQDILKTIKTQSLPCVLLENQILLSAKKTSRNRWYHDY